MRTFVTATRNIAVLILFAFVAEAYDEEQVHDPVIKLDNDLADNLAGKLFMRAIQILPSRHADLDDTTIGKQTTSSKGKLQFQIDEEEIRDGISKLAKLADGALTAFTKSPWFREKVTFAFKTIDVDDSGVLTHKELKGALGILYLQLANRVGVRIKLPGNEEIDELLQKVDVNHDSKLTLEEFTNMSVILCKRLPVQLRGALIRKLIALPGLLFIFRGIFKETNLEKVPDVVLIEGLKQAWQSAQDYIPALERFADSDVFYEAGGKR